MVYKRYIVRNGKRYGPYYYQSKRVGGKPVTLYVSSRKKKTESKEDIARNIDKSFLLRYFNSIMKTSSSSNVGSLSSKALPFFAGLTLGIGIIFILLLTFQFTGNSVFNVGGDYSDGSAFDGTFKVNMAPNSNTTEYLVVTNNNRSTLTVNFAIDDNLRNYVFLPEKVQIPPYSSVHVKVEVKLKEEAVYGNITIIGGEENKVVPVSIILKNEKEQSLDFSATTDKTHVEQGDQLDLRIFLSNALQMKRYNTLLNFDLVYIKTNSSFFQQGESVVVESALTLTRRLVIPRGIPSGNYILEVSATHEDVVHHSYVRLTIGSEPAFIVTFVKEYFVSILLLIFVSCTITFSGYYYVFIRRKQFKKKMEELQKNSIYPFPDFETLPQSKYAHIGIVADTEEKAYFDPAQLTRHTLIAGGTGSGKTVSGMVIVEELLKRGASVIVLDPVGQWTGFIKPNGDKGMKEKYKKFGIKSPQGFSTRIIQLDDASLSLDVIHYMNQKGLTILRMDSLTPAKADAFVESTLEQIYRAKLTETAGLKTLVVLDEVHRLLPKYGGKKAYTKIEQAVREFRKWGVGLLMISQVLTDFKGAIRGNIGTEVQMHSRYEGDIKRVRERHGATISQLISKMPVGIGMVESAGMNKGNPYFIEFRPLLHSPLKLSEKDIASLVKKEVPVLKEGLVVDVKSGKKSKSMKNKPIDEIRGGEMSTSEKKEEIKD